MLNNSHPLKAVFLSLSRLGRAHVAISYEIGHRTDPLSFELSSARTFLQRLVEILDASRYVVSYVGRNGLLKIFTVEL